MYETINIEKVERSCPACEDYAKEHSTSPPKIAVMACEGACSKGEVARRAANMVAHRMAPDSTVRICLGGAFTKDTGQRELVRRAGKVIAIEGCFISCSSRMMKGALKGLDPVIIQADTLYDADLPFGIDEVSEEELSECARVTAETVVKEHINTVKSGKKISKKETVCGASTGKKPGCCGQ